MSNGFLAALPAIGFIGTPYIALRPSFWCKFKILYPKMCYSIPSSLIQASLPACSLSKYYLTHFSTDFVERPIRNPVSAKERTRNLNSSSDLHRLNKLCMKSILAATLSCPLKLFKVFAASTIDQRESRSLWLSLFASEFSWFKSTAMSPKSPFFCISLLISRGLFLKYKASVYYIIFSAICMSKCSSDLGANKLIATLTKSLRAISGSTIVIGRTTQATTACPRPGPNF